MEKHFVIGATIQMPRKPRKKRQRSTIINGNQYYECPLCKGYFDSLHVYEGFGKYEEFYICVSCSGKAQDKIKQAQQAVREAKEG